jgi:hypothetical protein
LRREATPFVARQPNDEAKYFCATFRTAEQITADGFARLDVGKARIIFGSLGRRLTMRVRGQAKDKGCLGSRLSIIQAHISFCIGIAAS